MVEHRTAYAPGTVDAAAAQDDAVGNAAARNTNNGRGPGATHPGPGRYCGAAKSGLQGGGLPDWKTVRRGSVPGTGHHRGDPGLSLLGGSQTGPNRKGFGKPRPKKI